MRNRPTHLSRRTVQERHFGEDVTLIRTTGYRDENQEWRPSESPVTIRCATAPMPGDDARRREIEEGGVRLDEVRLFWTRETLDPASLFSAGDILVFEGERFRVGETERWHEISESVAIRQEGQEAA